MRGREGESGRGRGREFVPINVWTGCGGGGRAACIFLAKKVLSSLDLPVQMRSKKIARK